MNFRISRLMSYQNHPKMKLLAMNSNKIGIIFRLKIEAGVVPNKNHQIYKGKNKGEVRLRFLEDKKQRILSNFVEKNSNSCSRLFGDDF